LRITKVPNIVDPAALSFVNTKIRPTADAMGMLYHTAKELVLEWNALSMSAKIPNDASVIMDGAATDGRNVITGIMATAIVTEAMAVVAHYELAANAVLNQIVQAGVNEGGKF
jgi:hypothetical protein